MSKLAVRRKAAAFAAVVTIAFALGLGAPEAQSQASFVQDGEAGFVVSFIEYGLSKDASETGACPNGMTLGGNRLRVAVEAGEVPPPEAGSGEDFIMKRAIRYSQRSGNQNSRPQPGPEERRRIQQAELANTNPCANPEEYDPDPYWRTVEGPNIPARGIDLDGQDSRSDGRVAPGTCAHDDFTGFNGESGIDNQLFRVVGCSPSFQSNGSSVPFNIEMLTGSWGILIRLRGVDDVLNDDDVEVGVFANADPIELSPSREPLPYATYATWPDPRFRATTRGRIVDGVLTTDTVDFRFWKITNNYWLERPLKDMRLRMTVSPNGALDGYMSGYTPVEELYDFQYGFRSATTGPDGEPAPRAIGSALGASVTVGHTCHGAWHALWAAADGHPDEEGRCTSISTQYHIKAIPAFVVDAQTESINAGPGHSTD